MEEVDTSLPFRNNLLIMLDLGKSELNINITVSLLDCKSFENRGCLFLTYCHITTYLIATHIMLFKGVIEPGEEITTKLSRLQMWSLVSD